MVWPAGLLYRSGLERRLSSWKQPAWNITFFASANTHTHIIAGSPGTELSQQSKQRYCVHGTSNWRTAHIIFLCQFLRVVFTQPGRHCLVGVAASLLRTAEFQLVDRLWNPSRPQLKTVSLPSQVAANIIWKTAYRPHPWSRNHITSMLLWITASRQPESEATIVLWSLDVLWFHRIV
jgi:hypothetical protein